MPHLYEVVPNSYHFREPALSRSLGFLTTLEPPHYYAVIMSATKLLRILLFSHYGQE